MDGVFASAEVEGVGFSSDGGGGTRTAEAFCFLPPQEARTRTKAIRMATSVFVDEYGTGPFSNEVGPWSTSENQMAKPKVPGESVQVFFRC